MNPLESIVGFDGKTIRLYGNTDNKCNHIQHERDRRRQKFSSKSSGPIRCTIKMICKNSFWLLSAIIVLIVFDQFKTITTHDCNNGEEQNRNIDFDDLHQRDDHQRFGKLWVRLNFFIFFILFDSKCFSLFSSFLLLKDFCFMTQVKIVTNLLFLMIKFILFAVVCIETERE